MSFYRKIRYTTKFVLFIGLGFPVAFVSAQNKNPQTTDNNAFQLEKVFTQQRQVMLLIKPVSGQILDGNQAALEFYGLSKQELRETTIQEINTFTPAQVAEERRLAAREGRNYFIFRHRAAGGEIRTVQVHSYPVEIKGQKILFSNIYDITNQREGQGSLWHYQERLEEMVDAQTRAIRRRNRQVVWILVSAVIMLTGLVLLLVWARNNANQARKRAQENEATLNAIFDGISDSVVFTNAEGKIIRANRGAQVTFGMSSGELEGLSFSELQDKKNAFQRRGNLSFGSPLNSGRDLFEAAYRRKDRQTFIGETLAAQITGPEGETMGTVGVIRDVTSRIESERQLRLAGAVFETATEAVMVVNDVGKVATVNSAFCRLSGFSQSEVLGETPFILKSSKMTIGDLYRVMKGVRRKGFWEGEFRSRRKNGSDFPVWLSVTRLNDWRGNLDGYVVLFSDITKRKQDEAFIWHQANFDALTGLANRNLFMDRFHQALERARRDKSKLPLLFIDLDRFKNINDAMGHHMGDQLLVAASRRLTSRLRKSDTVARLGGDEFAVLLPDIEQIHQIEDTVRMLHREMGKPYNIGGNEMIVPASIGVTVYPDDGTSPDHLLRNADSAMYKAKTKGRNDYQFFTHEMDLEAQHRQALETALYHALEKEEFFLVYQPIMDAGTGQVAGAETLVRWNHPVRGNIAPDSFIPLAEEIGIILPLGEWIFRQACRRAAAWPGGEGRVAVNFSSRQFDRRGVLPLVRNVLAETGLPPERLTIEITESLLLRDEKHIIKQFQAIRELGISLAIDDFGTGYSALAYLKKFPVNILKIDRSFIQDLPEDRDDAILVEAILSVAESLNLKVVAEGVETPEQIAFLRERGCQYLQGYYFSKPVPDSDFVNFLRDWKPGLGGDPFPVRA